MLCVPGDGDEDHEQDTVQQLQEVIEQLRNVFPSEPGESLSDPTDLRQTRHRYNHLLVHIKVVSLLLTDRSRVCTVY